MNRAGSAANNPISDARCSSLALYSSLAEYSFVHFNRLFWQSSVDTMSGWTQCMVTRTILSFTWYTRQNNHSITTKHTTVSLYLQLAVVQSMITEGSGCGQFWQCRKCGHWDQRAGGDHNGVINMTLLCNQWSVSHNGLSLGAPEVMTHVNGTQWSLHTVVMQTPVWERWGAVTRYNSDTGDTSPTPHSASSNISSPETESDPNYISSFISNIISSKKAIIWLNLPWANF